MRKGIFYCVAHNERETQRFLTRDKLFKQQYLHYRLSERIAILNKYTWKNQTLLILIVFQINIEFFTTKSLLVVNHLMIEHFNAKIISIRPLVYEKRVDYCVVNEFADSLAA